MLQVKLGLRLILLSREELGACRTVIPLRGYWLNIGAYARGPRSADSLQNSFEVGRRASQTHRPTKDSGPIPGTADETWSATYHALIKGRRGLPGSWSLPRVLVEYRGVRNRGQVNAVL